MPRFKHIKHQRGYWLVFKPEHPFCNNQGYVPEHRLVMENKIGRIIDPRKEHVHHINKIKTDNRVHNLMLLAPIDHARIEKGWELRNGEWRKPCSGCRKMLPITSFYIRSSGAKYFSICIECCSVRYFSKKEKGHDQ